MGSALRHDQIGIDMSVAVEVNALHRAVRERLPNGVLRNIELAAIMRHVAFL